MPSKEYGQEYQPSTLENVDFAFYDWIDKRMDIFTTTHDGFKKIPIIWSSPERAFQIKNTKEFRDSKGTLILPLITVERASVEKNPESKGTYWGNVPPIDNIRGGSITIAKKINVEKTRNYRRSDSRRASGGSADIGHQQENFPTNRAKSASVLYGGKNPPEAGKTIVYNVMTVPMPVYIDVVYKVNIMTNYQQQMNEIIAPFITRPGGINYQYINKNGHRYEAFIQPQFAFENNISSMDVEERLYKTSLDIKVLAYLIGSDKNQIRPKIAVRETVAKVKLPREKVIFGDIPEHNDPNTTFYKE